MMNQLKACPFCSGEADLLQYAIGGFSVECKECFTRTNTYITKEKAIKEWNSGNVIEENY